MRTTYISTAALFAFLGMGLMSVRADAQTRYPRPHEVNHRLNDQHARIRQGVRSGQLTHREAEHLRLTDARIHAQERRDRIRHGGHLTRHETRRLNRELNHESHQIYHDKHNGRVR